jgi:hypothetical protein
MRVYDVRAGDEHKPVGSQPARNPRIQTIATGQTSKSSAHAGPFFPNSTVHPARDRFRGLGGSALSGVSRYALLLHRRYGNHYMQRIIAEMREAPAEAEMMADPESAIERKHGGTDAVEDGLVSRVSDPHSREDRNDTRGGAIYPQAEKTQSDQTPGPTASQEPTDDNTEIISMPPIAGKGEPAEISMEGGCDGLSLHGTTNATFDGGRFRLTNRRVTRGTGCSCPSGVDCLHVTGTLVTDYSVAVTITMPPVPGGLTPCERAHVQRFLRNVLRPHELDHKRRFETYNGRTRTPMDITDCGRAGIDSAIEAMQSAENSARQTAANNLSAAIDPFVRAIDCSDCERDT